MHWDNQPTAGETTAGADYDHEPLVTMPALNLRVYSQVSRMSGECNIHEQALINDRDGAKLMVRKLYLPRIWALVEAQIDCYFDTLELAKGEEA